MIDLHCHILPGIDDGAGELADSIAMARQAADDGIEAVCATPHIRHDHDVRIDEIEGRAADLRERARAAGGPGRGPARRRGGGDRGRAGSTTEELRRVALGEGRWILLEPAPGPLSDSLERRVEQLAARGHRSLIAHPERHLAEDLAERLVRLVRQGALIQATADSSCATRLAPGMLALAERGLVHVLGSDAHSSRFGRPVRISACARGPGAGWTLLRPHLRWIARRRPAAIIAGGELETPFEPV